MNFVVDASVAIKWFVEEDLRADARELARRSEELVAPDFILAEISNVLWKKTLRKEITRLQARSVFARSFDPFSRLYPMDLLHGRALEIALELRHPVYDCLYLACTEEVEDGRVVTVDRRFCAAVASTGFADRVIHLSDLFDRP